MGLNLWHKGFKDRIGGLRTGRVSGIESMKKVKRLSARIYI